MALDGAAFHAEIAVSGEIALSGEVAGPGVSARSGLARWQGFLSEGHVDDTGRGQKRLDSGLVEVYFQRTGGGWECTGFTVQTHRLAWGGCSLPAGLPGGGDPAPFPRRTSARAVLEAIAARGRTAEECPPSGGYQAYRVPESGAVIQALTAEVEGNPQRVGDLWSLSITRLTPGAAGEAGSAGAAGAAGRRGRS